MATLGSTTEQDDFQSWYGGGTYNQFASPLTLPAGGPWKITDAAVWFAGKDSAATARVCVWHANGSLIDESATFSATGKGFALGANTFYDKPMPSQVSVAGGTTVWVGFITSDADPRQYGFASTGTHYRKHDSTPTGSMSSADSQSGKMGVSLTYVAANTTPGAPTNVKLESVASGSRLSGSDNLYLLTFTGNDPGDTLDAWDWVFDTTTGNGVVPDWVSPPFAGSGEDSSTSTIVGQSVSLVLNVALARGQWYALRVRTYDQGATNPGAYSAPVYYIINQLPTATKVAPTASQFAYIHNLEDLAVWTSGGAHAKPRFQWTFADPEGGAQTAFRVRVYSASTAGTLLHDSGKITGAATSWDAGLGVGSTGPTWAGVLGTEYWWTIEVWDAFDESSVESSRTAFKMRWAQAIYEWNAGAGSSSWGFANAAVIAGEGAFAFASATATNGTGRSAWFPSIGDVSVAAYLNVLVRIQPNATPGTTPQLPDMTFSYLGAASTPDRWLVTGTGWSFVLDPSVKRYGSQSLKVTSGTTAGGIYPFRKTSGDDIPVQPNTTYTISVWVRTNAALPADLTIRVMTAGGATALFTGSTAATPAGATRDTRSFPESWQRLSLTFKTSATTTAVRPQLWYLGTTSQAFWVDGWKMEEGTVATAWTPGFVGDPVVLDANGIVVDAFAGGILRARGSTGAARDGFELGPHGLLFTDVELWSPTAEVMQIGDGTAAQELIVEGPASGTVGGKVTLAGAGAVADTSMTNDNGTLRVPTPLKTDSTFSATGITATGVDAPNLPTAASARVDATAGITLGTTAADITGATVTFTPTVNELVLIVANFDFRWTANGSTSAYGRIVVDGVAQAPEARFRAGTANDGGATVMTSVVVSLTAGVAHTIKLQAYKSAAAATVTAGGTAAEAISGFTYIRFKA